MVVSKKIHCVICNKKCSGNVLRYQDNYYHKQCFELDQRQEQNSSTFQQVTNPNYNQESSANQIPLAEPALDTVDSEKETLTTYTNKYTRQHYQTQTQSSIFTHPNKSKLDGTGDGGSSQLMHRQKYTASGDTKDYTSQMGPLDSRSQMGNEQKSRTIDATASGAIRKTNRDNKPTSAKKSATLPHSTSSPVNGFDHLVSQRQFTACAGCKESIKDGQALIALDLHWHVWCFKCTECQTPLHGEYVAKDGKAYCEKDYQKLFGVSCVYCKRYITGKVLQAGETHHFHPSCARCSKCGDPFVPGEEMYLQGEVTWHPRCGPGPDSAPGQGLDEIGLMNMEPSSRSQSRSASPFSYISRQYDRASPYADSEAVGDLSRVYTISYLSNDPTQGYLRRPIEPPVPKSPQFTRPTSTIRSDRSRSSSRSHSHLASSNTNYNYAGSSMRDRSIPRGMYSVLSSMSRGSQSRARSPSMMNEEAIHLAQYPSGQKPNPDAVAKIERDDFPAPPFPYSKQQAKSHPDQIEKTGSPAHVNADAPRQQQRASRPKSREIVITDDANESSMDDDPQFRKEEEELSKIANGIGKIFLQTLKEREKLRAWKRANLDPRNASRTPSATRELSSRMRYDNPTNASPSRDMDRPRPWGYDEQAASSATVGGDQSPTRTRSSLGQRTPVAGSKVSSPAYGYKVVQSSRTLPRPGYGVTGGPYESNGSAQHHASEMSFNQQQLFTQARSSDLLARANGGVSQQSEICHAHRLGQLSGKNTRPAFGSPLLRRSMPNMAQLNQLHHIYSDGPPKLYPYHLLATSNYRLPPDVDRCHLERHLSNEEFQYIFHCDRLDFYRLPEWKRNELKRRAKLF